MRIIDGDDTSDPTTIGYEGIWKNNSQDSERIGDSSIKITSKIENGGS